MNKAEKIRHIYSAVISVFAVAMGIALICVAADIYYSGKGTGVIFTREIVSDKLKALSIPFIILIGLIACGSVFPLCEAKAKHKSEDALKLLRGKKPSGGDGEQYDSAKKQYDKLAKIRYIVWGCALAVTLAGAIASLCYLLKTAHFKGTDVTGEIFDMVRHVLPWVAVTFVALIAAAVTNGALAGKQLKALKTLIKYGNGEAENKAEFAAVQAIKKLAENDVALWVVRGIIFAVAVTFIILGALNGGANDVMVKAVNICTECIGLG